MTFSCASRPKSSRGAMNLAACSRAKRARRFAEGDRRSRPAPARSSISSPARRCAFPARNSPACAPDVDVEVDARAGRRHRDHRAVEFPDRNSLLEDRAGAGLRQLRRLQAGRPRAGFGPGACRDHRAGRRRRRACSTSSWGAARWSAQAMLDDSRVDAITFTGSVATGRARRRRLRERHAQVPARDGRQEPAGGPRRRRSRQRGRMRGRTAPISRPASVAPRPRASSSRNRSTSRFAEALMERMRRLVVDDALKAGTPYRAGRRSDAARSGPLPMSRSARAKARSWRSAASGSIARRPASTWRRRCSSTPTIAMRIAREEIFGPVAAMIPARDYDQALAIANDTEFGLCAGICTTSLKRARTSSAMRRPAW